MSDESSVMDAATKCSLSCVNYSQVNNSASAKNVHSQNDAGTVDGSCEAVVNAMAHERGQDAKQACNDNADAAEGMKLGSVASRAICLQLQSMCAECIHSAKSALCGLEGATDVDVEGDTGIVTMRLAGGAHEAVRALRAHNIGAWVIA